mmetsp:Transcript_24765/g.58048  ORF Transcript_24765/g.58048 Transcript_24765/m.58048 type:complete len:258 (-) Transcript_24765:240-1013(-)
MLCQIPSRQPAEVAVGNGAGRTAGPRFNYGARVLPNSLVERIALKDLVAPGLHSDLGFVQIARRRDGSDGLTCASIRLQDAGHGVVTGDVPTEAGDLKGGTRHSALDTGNVRADVVGVVHQVGIILQVAGIVVRQHHRVRLQVTRLDDVKIAARIGTGLRAPLKEEALRLSNNEIGGVALLDLPVGGDDGDARSADGPVQVLTLVGVRIYLTSHFGSAGVTRSASDRKFVPRYISLDGGGVGTTLRTEVIIFVEHII